MKIKVSDLIVKSINSLMIQLLPKYPCIISKNRLEKIISENNPY